MSQSAQVIEIQDASDWLPPPPPDGKKGIVLVGNPGTGKSTILNGLAGKVVFKYGISFGSGLTTMLNWFHTPTATVYDTPGLYDMGLVKKAGEELDMLLQTGEDISICFVVTLENGRVPKEDATTLDLVLSSITDRDMNNRFGVIINQMDPYVIEAWNKSDENTRFVRSFITGRYETTHWMYVEFDHSIAAKYNKMYMNGELKKFLFDIPSTVRKDSGVKSTYTGSFKEFKKEHAKHIRLIEKLNAKRNK